MSRQLTSGVLGRKNNLAVILANNYISRVISEPYRIIGAGILNWDIDGNPPTDLFNANGVINPNNYDNNAAKLSIINEFSRMLNEELEGNSKYEALRYNVGSDYGMELVFDEISNLYRIQKVFDLSPNHYDFEASLASERPLLNQQGIDRRNSSVYPNTQLMLSEVDLFTKNTIVSFNTFKPYSLTASLNRHGNLQYNIRQNGVGGILFYMRDINNNLITFNTSTTNAYSIESVVKLKVKWSDDTKIVRIERDEGLLMGQATHNGEKANNANHRPFGFSGPGGGNGVNTIFKQTEVYSY